jgi:DNA ligase-1
LIKDLALSKVDPYLFEYSYDYIGELSETIAHIWPDNNKSNIHKQRNKEDLSLTDLIKKFNDLDNKQQVSELLESLLNKYTPQERWALIKLGTKGLRIGVSSRFIKKVLAEYGQVDIQEIEEIWHGLKPPYENLFKWLEGKAEKPSVENLVNFIPVMLSHPLEQKDLEQVTPDKFQVEWKLDGIRVQLVSNGKDKALFSRTGDDISKSFPDLLSGFETQAVLDGELLVKKDSEIGSFNDLQQRLNKKKPSEKLMKNLPSHLVTYDILSLKGEDLRSKSLSERREILEKLFPQLDNNFFSISSLLSFENIDDLNKLRDISNYHDNKYVEGLMLKKLDSKYVSARPKGQWYKWKRDPFTIDAIMMYAQRGHGKRSSFYSDYTFGLFKDESMQEILPVGKAYSGFTDEELTKLDKFVRDNTIDRFGPVREVEKTLVVELAFDSVNESSRHKSGLAMRFPRIKRIRWDKPVNEADLLQNLRNLIV